MRNPRPRLDPDKVIRRRYMLGLTATQLAERADRSRSLICDVEHGRRPGSPETQQAIAAALDIDVSALYADDAEDAA